MRMFWTHRLRQEDDGSAWQLSYADLMSLLMAVFVLIVTMSDLRPGKRFNAVSTGLRSAFGFQPKEAAVEPAQKGRQTLAQRLEQIRRSRPAGAGDDAVAMCEVVTDPEQVTVRLAGADAFLPGSASMAEPAKRAVERLAEYLAGGTAAVEVRGHAEPGEDAQAGGGRDLVDLSYGRAKSVAEILTRAGVSAQRLSLVAVGDHLPLTGTAVPGAGRRVEMIVHAAPNAVMDPESPRKSS